MLTSQCAFAVTLCGLLQRAQAADDERHRRVNVVEHRHAGAPRQVYEIVPATIVVFDRRFAIL